LPYRATFEQALGGDFSALHTIFTRPEYHSGDNEAWLVEPWHILQVVGDKRFAEFVLSRPPAERRRIMFYVPYISPYQPTQAKEFDEYFRIHYPATRALWELYKPRPAHMRAI
jgi:hypothetical protein